MEEPWMVARPARGRMPTCIHKCLLAAAMVTPLAAAHAGTYSLSSVTAEDTARALALNSPVNHIRYQRLRTLLNAAGCRKDALQEIRVPRAAEPDLVCTLAGTLTPDHAPDPRRVIVIARYDRIGPGSGAIDNWSGAAMLPLLYAAVLPGYREHTLQFVATYGPEGLPAFLRSLHAQEKKATVSILDMRDIGITATRLAFLQADERNAPATRKPATEAGGVPASSTPDAAAETSGGDPGQSPITTAEKNDIRLFARHAAAGITRLALPPIADPYRETFLAAHPQTARDEASVILDSGIPGVVFHSITRGNATIPGSSEDAASLIDPAAYFASYFYAAIYLLVLDHPRAAVNATGPGPATAP